MKNRRSRNLYWIFISVFLAYSLISHGSDTRMYIKINEGECLKCFFGHLYVNEISKYQEVEFVFRERVRCPQKILNARLPEITGAIRVISSDSLYNKLSKSNLSEVIITLNETIIYSSLFRRIPYQIDSILEIISPFQQNKSFQLPDSIVFIYPLLFRLSNGFWIWDRITDEMWRIDSEGRPIDFVNPSSFNLEDVYTALFNDSISSIYINNLYILKKFGKDKPDFYSMYIDDTTHVITLIVPYCEKKNDSINIYSRFLLFDKKAKKFYNLNEFKFHEDHYAPVSVLAINDAKYIFFINSFSQILKVPQYFLAEFVKAETSLEFRQFLPIPIPEFYIERDLTGILFNPHIKNNIVFFNEADDIFILDSIRNSHLNIGFPNSKIQNNIESIENDLDYLICDVIRENQHIYCLVYQYLPSKQFLLVSINLDTREYGKKTIKNLSEENRGIQLTGSDQVLYYDMVENAIKQSNLDLE